MTHLDENRIAELISAYGADVKHWPQDERLAGQNWLVENPEQAERLLAGAAKLDRELDMFVHADQDISLLQARIMKAAKATPQNLGENAATPNMYKRNRPALHIWKSIAAIIAVTFTVTGGIGFGIGMGQMASADTEYETAEALLAMSMHSSYEEQDMGGDGL